MSNEIADQELNTGVRFSWNVWPPNRTEAGKAVVPLSCMFTPLKDTNNLQLVEYEPIRCRSTGCILNPYCQVEFRQKTWQDPFSSQRNSFPSHYADHISEQSLPAELMFPTIEYILPHHTTTPAVPPAIFLFCVDTCISYEELDQVKDSIQQALNIMPQESLVGLVTFGTMCHVYELGFPECPKSFVFKGSKELTSQSVQSQLGFSVRNDPRGASAGAGSRRFLLPVSECEVTLSGILDDLEKDPWGVGVDSRPLRCTGVALTVCVGLLECCASMQPGRLIMFLGGACTQGVGMVVSPQLSEPIRSHLDLQKDNPNAKYSKKALKFYTSIAHRAVQNFHAIDVFCCSLDQSGLYEMRVMSDKTGGVMVMSDSFSMHVFKDSFKKMFELDSGGFLRMGFNSRVEILCSKEFRVCGAVGACTSTLKKASFVSESVVGEGNTCEWQVCVLDRNSTLAFYFEMVNQQTPATGAPRQSFLQFQTQYTHPSGRKRLRVVTISYRYAEPGVLDLSTGFDQEAAAALMSRLAVVKTETEESLDVLRWLDRMLIRLVSRFADYRKDHPSSFHLSSEFGLYPQFMYHLRRSHFLQTFNASPDETAYYRSVLSRETTMSTLVMIQPALLQYSFDDGPPVPVLLDVQSLKPNVILLCDSYFHVVIWHGETIHSWKLEGYQDRAEYENFKRLLQAPAEDAQAILEERFPVPKFVQCNSGGSQARFLLAKVNPSATHNSLTGGMGGQNDTNIVITDDVPMKVFMDHLKKLAVQS
eukprot:GHVR01113017.1.p1 GENE.GHVR01113017.1~~GHVR01113017.1.p1  ORF type:complete len:760 (+),score=146.04 GHVR01113017.1:67-2346(+)